MSAQTQTRYKITNTTVKPPRLDEHGRDIRSVRERVGHGVCLVLDDKSDRNVVPGRPVMLNHLPECALRYAAEGKIAIEEIKGGISEALKGHAVIAKETAEAEAAKVAQAETAAAAEAPKHAAKVQEMGLPNNNPEAAVNPDGEPNFAVVAPSASATKRATSKTKA